MSASKPQAAVSRAESHFPSIADQLVSQGYALDELDDELAERVRHALAGAADFFDSITELPVEVRESLQRRQADGRAALFTGFRRPGQEYAQVSERPDLMQSFSLMAADRNRLPAEVWRYLQQHPFIGNLFAIRQAIIRRATAALDQLGRQLRQRSGLQPAPVADLTAHSFLQLNSYRPRLFEQRYQQPGQTPLAKRTYLEDPHEDGQLLTRAAAKDSGLVGRCRDGSQREFELIPPSHQRMLVMTSLPFTYYTGGPAHGGIPPFEHAVVREVQGRAVENRTSLICFVNPNVRQPLPALVPSPENRDISIPLLVNEAQWRFGLPRYEALDAVAADTAERTRTMELLDRLYRTGKK